MDSDGRGHEVIASDIQFGFIHVANHRDLLSIGFSRILLRGNISTRIVICNAELNRNYSDLATLAMVAPDA